MNCKMRRGKEMETNYIVLLLNNVSYYLTFPNYKS